MKHENRKKSAHNYQDSWSSNYVKQKRCIQVSEKRKGQSTQTRGMSSTTKIALGMKTLCMWITSDLNLQVSGCSYESRQILQD